MLLLSRPVRSTERAGIEPLRKNELPRLDCRQMTKKSPDVSFRPFCSVVISTALPEPEPSAS